MSFDSILFILYLLIRFEECGLACDASIARSRAKSRVNRMKKRHFEIAQPIKLANFILALEFFRFATSSIIRRQKRMEKRRKEKPTTKCNKWFNGIEAADIKRLTHRKHSINSADDIQTYVISLEQDCWLHDRHTHTGMGMGMGNACHIWWYKKSLLYLFLDNKLDFGTRTATCIAQIARSPIGHVICNFLVFGNAQRSRCCRCCSWRQHIAIV